MMQYNVISLVSDVISSFVMQQGVKMLFPVYGLKPLAIAVL